LPALGAADALLSPRGVVAPAPARTSAGSTATTPRLLARLATSLRISPRTAPAVASALGVLAADEDAGKAAGAALAHGSQLPAQPVGADGTVQVTLSRKAGPNEAAAKAKAQQEALERMDTDTRLRVRAPCLLRCCRPAAQLCML
jgi:hypothetical protein